MRVKRQLIAALSLLAVATTSQAKKHEVLLKSSDMTLSQPSANTYVLRVDLPVWLKSRRVEYGTIEFFIEGNPSEDSGLPYALELAPVTGFSPGDTTYTISPGRWSNHLGVSEPVSERIKMDITPLLRHWLSEDGARYVVLRRTATGAPRVNARLKSGVIGTDVIARIRVFSVRQ